MSSYKDNITRVVAVKTGPGDLMYYAYVIGYVDAPTYLLETTDGTQLSWRCDLCESLPPEEETAYWKNRAYIAEHKLEQGNKEKFKEIT